jgi:filamentous hemagglutinin
MPVSPQEKAIKEYLSSLRISDANRGKVEMTGIHNDGRIYSGADMSLASNSVLHNNRGALIYSGGNAELNIKDVLFNNANAAGQGVFINGGLNISGTSGGRMSQLINYDGAMESNGGMTINAGETINYGSDEQDFSDVNVLPASKYANSWQHLANVPSGDWHQVVLTDKSYATLLVNSEASTLRSNNGTLSILSDNVVNYNSRIKGFDISIETSNLLNRTFTANVMSSENYVLRHYKCTGKAFGKCVWHQWWNDYWTNNVVASAVGNSPASIIAANNLNIKANTIGNGAAGKSDIGHGANLPHDPVVLPETNLQEIVRTGTIDPLAGFKLPEGKYGAIRQADAPDSAYLYETDPLLVDLSRYLGSQYFMNRIGVDPHDVEAKFMGDAFVEHEMIKKSLEQISSFRNTSMTDGEIDAYIDNMYNALTEEMIADLGLQFGKPLTTEQIAQLDDDIVWYVKQMITLPDGEQTEVLAPQVYLCQNTLNELYGAALAREDTKTSIRGNNVSIEALDAEAESVLTNSGSIIGNRQLVISTDEINNAAATIGSQQPVLRGGDLLSLNTGGGGKVNNLGGAIETINAGSMVSIDTGELNNMTLTQLETMDQGFYKKTETRIGAIAAIASAGGIAITTTADLNMAGSRISAKDDAALDVGRNLNSTAVKDYRYEYMRHKEGYILSSEETVDIHESVKNITSSISAGNDLNINVEKNLFSICANFKAESTLSIDTDNIYL